MTKAQQTFPHRIGYLTTCIIPANLLSDESTDSEDPSSLRADAGHEGLSFIRVMRDLEGGVYVTRVAASPDLLVTGYTVLLSEEQLYFALPWEARLEWEDRLHCQKRCASSILALLHAHAAEVQPLTAKTSGQLAHSFPVPTLTPVDTVEVLNETLRDAIAFVQSEDTASSRQRQTSPFHLQQACLQAMIDTLMQQLYQAEERAHARIIQARCSLLVQVQRWHRCTRQERIVNAVPTFSQERQQILWRLTAGFPLVA